MTRKFNSFGAYAEDTFGGQRQRVVMQFFQNQPNQKWHTHTVT